MDERLALREQVPLVALTGAAVWAFATAYRQPLSLAFLAPAAISIAWRLPRVGDLPRRLLPRVAQMLAAATALFGLAWTVYPVLSPHLVEILPVVLGYALLSLGVLGLLGSAAWPPSTASVPAALGTLVAACLEPLAHLNGPLILAAAAACGYLLGATRPRETAPAVARRLARVAVFALLAGTIALGIARLLPWAQPKVEAVAARMLTESPVAFAGLGTTSRLGSIERIARSRRVAMRIWARKPQKLRARVFTRFDGVAWRAPRIPVHALDPMARGAEPAVLAGDLPGTLFAVPGRAIGGGGIETRILQRVFNGGALVAPAGLVRVRLPSGTAAIDDFGILQPIASGIEIYGTFNRPELVDEVPCDACLEVPADTDPRIRELADHLGEGSAEEKVRRTTAWLGRECRYSLTPGRFRGRQPVAEFLFEKKRGYCEYFASSAALLLRLEGVPTRYVTGFNVTEASRMGDHYLVLEADAHAWIEARLPGRGWTEVDPTPPGQYDALHADLRGGALAATWERLRGRLARLAGWISTGDWAGLARWLGGRIVAALDSRVAAVLAMALALVLGLRSWRRRERRPRRRAGAGSPELARLLDRVDADCARRGAPRPPGRGPLEHLAGLSPQGLPAGWQEATHRAVEGYYRGRFGGEDPRPDELAALAAGLDRAGIA